MEQLGLALVAFIGGHELLSHPWRQPIVSRIGEKAFAGLYSVVALGTFAWVVFAFRAAPLVSLWVAPSWVWTLGSLVMLGASILLAGAFLVPNPSINIQGNVLARSPSPQGVIRITRHPMLWSFALWAAVHAAVAGTAAAVLLSGGIGLFSLFGAWMLDRKKAAQLKERWATFETVTSFVPFGRGLAWPGWKATVGGLVVFVAATWLHPRLGAPVVGIWEYL